MFAFACKSNANEVFISLTKLAKVLRLECTAVAYGTDIYF